MQQKKHDYLSKINILFSKELTQPFWFPFILRLFLVLCLSQDTALTDLCIKHPGSFLHQPSQFFSRLFSISVSFPFLRIYFSTLRADGHLRFFIQISTNSKARCYLGPAVAADEVKVSASEDGRLSNLEADWAFQLLLLCLNLAVDELKKLQVRL